MKTKWINDAAVIFTIRIAHDFDFQQLPGNGFQWQMFVTNVTILLRLAHGGFVDGFFAEQPDFQKFLA